MESLGRALVLACAPALVASDLAAQRTGQVRSARIAPFRWSEDTGVRGVVTLQNELERDPLALARLAELHAHGEPVELAGLRLPGGREVSLELRPVGCMPAGARARVMEEDGSERWVEPRARCFAGTFPGGGQAFLGFAPGQVHGYLSAGGELYFLSSSGSPSGQATLAHATRTGTTADPFCTVGDLPDPKVFEALSAAAAPLLRIADVVIEVDDSLPRIFATADACLDYVTILVTASGEIFRRDVGLALRVPDGYLRVWKRPPPWGNTTTEAVTRWWNSRRNPERLLPRAMVHSLARGSGYGNASGTGGVCDEQYGAYCHSTCRGGFPYPIEHTDANNFDLYVVSHEFGHVFGCPHSFLFDPPVECNDGSGPDGGTLMTYCGAFGGMGRLGMRFHVREQRRLRAALAQRDCLKRVPLLPGDYDANGTLGRADLVAATAVLTQRFRSLGAEETFDLDRDGDFDAGDREILARIVSGEGRASVVSRNGSGANPVCLTSTADPVLGSIWSATITSESGGEAVLILRSDQPLDGLTTPFGELLVRPSGDGGRRVTTLATDGSGRGSFKLSLPADLSLVGARLHIQAAALGARGHMRLCNALELRLGTR